MKKNKTKIIATIGPASLSFRTFQAMVNEGINFIRINTSYGDTKQYDQILKNLKRVKSKNKIEIILDIKNLDILEYAKNNKIKYIALSFAENQKQIEAVRQRLPKCFVISKIETKKGVKNFDKILDASDGIMIARGDLGHAVSLPEIPPLQKEFTKKSLLKQKFVVTATEMMHSMTRNDKPTRAEVNDVATAVFDGSHAVMLSEETAIGKYPAITIKTMRSIINKAEKWLKKKDLVDKKIKHELDMREFRVSIFGSARIKKNDKLYKQTFELAKEIGENHIDVITGGGPGIMLAANAGHTAGDKNNQSDSLGLRIMLPWEIKDNGYLEIRKDFKKFSKRLDYFMALSGAVVVMPGGIGTCLEFFYSLQLTQVRHVHPIPIILMGKNWEKLYSWIKNYLIKDGYVSPHDINNIYIAKNNKEALKIILEHYRLFNEKGVNYYKEIKPYKVD